MNTLSEIDCGAVALRELWNLGSAPIPDLVRLLEEHGVLVCMIDTEADLDFDGLTLLAGDKPVIAVGSAWLGDRQRFTLSRELGHLLIDQHICASIDVETAANRFAGTFLVPTDAVQRELGAPRKSLSIRELQPLKRLYGLSMQGWIFRAADTGVIAEDIKRRLFTFLGSMGWKKSEPGAPLPQEVPSLMRSLVFRALSEGLIGNTKAAELLGLTQADFIKESSISDEDPRHR